MSEAVGSLWNLISATPRIDAARLAQAVEHAAESAEDFRTCLLIRDSVRAIKDHWGEQRLHAWLTSSPHRSTIERICESISADELGFPSLKRRIVDATQGETVLQFLRELSRHVVQPTRLLIGGSTALILCGYLSRQTEDIDVVDEVPANLRSEYQLLGELEEQYGLQLTHFQSHYLPSGWADRLHSVATLGLLHVFAVDAYDLFLSKLFSSRRKDREDLRAVLPHLERSVLETRLRDTAKSLCNDAKLREAAVENWYVLFGEVLPA